LEERTFASTEEHLLIWWELHDPTTYIPVRRAVEERACGSRLRVHQLSPQGVHEGSLAQDEKRALQMFELASCSFHNAAGPRFMARKGWHIAPRRMLPKLIPTVVSSDTTGRAQISAGSASVGAQRAHWPARQDDVGPAKRRDGPLALLLYSLESAESRDDRQSRGECYKKNQQRSLGDRRVASGKRHRERDRRAGVGKSRTCE
jgi:hypothetical protein